MAIIILSYSLTSVILQLSFNIFLTFKELWSVGLEGVRPIFFNILSFLIIFDDIHLRGTSHLLVLFRIATKNHNLKDV